MVIELGDQPVLRFIEEGRPTSVNGEPTVIRFPRVQIRGPGPGLFDEEVLGELVVDVQGRFEVDILDGAIGADGLGITDARLSIQKTGPGIETLAMDVRGGRLRMPLVKPIDLPSLRIGADGIIGQFNARHELVETIALTAIRLGEQLVLESVPVKLAIAASEEVTGFLQMTLADDASSVAMNVPGGIMNLTNWTVLSLGGFLGTVETTVGNPFTLPESEVLIADGSFSLRRTGGHFELHVSNALTIDVGFVSASFESDSYIASDGDCSFTSFVADDVHLGDGNVLAISGDSSVTLRKVNTSQTFEVTLNNARLRLPFNTSFDLPDLTFGIDGTLPAFPFAFPSGVTLGETFALPSELPFSLNVDSAGVVRLARTPAFDVRIIPGSLASFLPFHNMTLDSTGRIAAGAAGDLQIRYPIVVDGEIETMTFSLPTGISFDVTLDDGLFKVELPSPQQIDLGFFVGLFTGDVRSHQRRADRRYRSSANRDSRRSAFGRRGRSHV